MSQNEERKRAEEILDKWLPDFPWTDTLKRNAVFALQEFASERDSIRDELIEKESKSTKTVNEILNDWLTKDELIEKLEELLEQYKMFHAAQISPAVKIIYDVWMNANEGIESEISSLQERLNLNK